MLLSLVAAGWALDAHGFSFHGVTGDVEEYTRLGYPSAGLFGDADVSVLMDYARDPLTENTPDGRVPVLAALGTATVAGAFSFGGLRLEGSLPIHPIGQDPSGSFSALGDARLGALVPLPWLGAKAPLVGVHAAVVFPTGSAEHFVSAGSFRFEGTVLAAREFGPVGLIAMGGAVVSKPEEERNLEAGVGPILGLGASVRAGERFSTAVEFSGESEFGFTSLPIEGTLSARYRLPVGAWATAGAAMGLTGGVGASRWRLFAGVGWSFRKEDHVVETVELENPEADRDGDSIVDRDDLCPDQAETVDSFADGDGCPELDGDQDGVPFVRDQCPEQAIFAAQDPRYSDGCPQVAELAGDRITIAETIFFKEGRADLLPESERVLGAVRDLMQSNPTLGPVLISGHTNQNGAADFNGRLSDARAYAVMVWLVEQGVDPARLISKGFGESQPLVDPRSAEAEARNRRVEFQVMERAARPEGARQLSPAEQARWREGRVVPVVAEAAMLREEKTEEGGGHSTPTHQEVPAKEPEAGEMPPEVAGSSVSGVAGAAAAVGPEHAGEVHAGAPAAESPAGAATSVESTSKKKRKKVRPPPDSVDHY